MTLKISLDLYDHPTYGQLFRFVDLARAAGIKEEEPLDVDTHDEHGNDIGAHTVTANLGDLNGLGRPVLIDGADARDYANSLYRELQQESDVQTDGPVLNRLLEALWAGIDAHRE